MQKKKVPSRKLGANTSTSRLSSWSPVTLKTDLVSLAESLVLLHVTHPTISVFLRLRQGCIKDFFERGSDFQNIFVHFVGLFFGSTELFFQARTNHYKDYVSTKFAATLTVFRRKKTRKNAFLGSF